MAYCTSADLNQVWGTESITAWATLDSGDVALTITARKTAAITFADAYIDAVMRTASYTIPLVTSAGATPSLINNISAILAGVWLYEARGSKDFDPATGAPHHKLAFRKLMAEKLLEELRTRRILLDAV